MGEGHAFKHGSGHAPGIGFIRQAQKRPAHMRIVVRGALAGQVGEEQFRACAWPSRFGSGEEGGNIYTGQPRGPIDAACRRQMHAHLVPHAGQAVAEGVDGARGVGAEI